MVKEGKADKSAVFRYLWRYLHPRRGESTWSGLLDYWITGFLDSWIYINMLSPSN